MIYVMLKYLINYHNFAINQINPIMMKKILLAISFMLAVLFVQAQAEKVYDENADAAADIKKAVEQAKVENKNVMIFIGGNWCPWCLRLNKFIHEDEELSSALYDHYIVVKMNYDKDHINMPVLTELEFPQRFGFPVLVVLNQEGKRIHTQNSAYLELDKSYDKKRLLGFFGDWTVQKLDAANYIK